MQTQIVFDFLQRHLDRIFVDRAQVSVDFANGFFGRIRVFDEKLLDEFVLVRVQHQAFGMLAIATGSASFLIIGLDATGEVIMNHESQIRFVDPHAKRVRRDDDLDLARHELFLDLPPHVDRQTRVIKRDAAIDFFGQQFDQLLAALASRSVDDSATGVRFQKLDQCLVFFDVAFGGFDGKGQIGSRETGDELGVVFKSQDFGDVVLNKTGRGGG